MRISSWGLRGLVGALSLLVVGGLMGMLGHRFVLGERGAHTISRVSSYEAAIPAFAEALELTQEQVAEVEAILSRHQAVVTEAWGIHEGLLFADMSSAIISATNLGAQVINLSLGDPACATTGIGRQRPQRDRGATQRTTTCHVRGVDEAAAPIARSARRAWQMKKIGVLTLCVALTALGAWFLASGRFVRSADAESGSSGWETASVERMNIGSTVLATGVIRPQVGAEVARYRR